MKSFLLKLLLYIFPIIIYVLMNIGVPYYAGEFDRLEDVALRQMSNEQPILYGRAYKDNFTGYKLVSAKLRKADILALGSSRVMEFRSGLFNEETAFYNAAGGADNIFALHRFLEGLEANELPIILIVGLDQDWFHPVRAQQALDNRAEPIDLETSFGDKNMLNVGRMMLGDWLTGDLSIVQLLNKKDPIHGDAAIGVRAITSGNGFRQDGSYQHGSLLTDMVSNDERFAEARQRIKDGSKRFNYGNEFSRTATDEIVKFLDYCVEHDIYVIGFSPPYAPSIYSEMSATGKYGYIAKMSAYLEEVFGTKGFTYFDFSNGSLPEVTDDDYLDGFHGSEFVYLQIYRQMLESLPDILGAYSNPITLRELAQEQYPNRFEIFAN